MEAVDTSGLRGYKYLDPTVDRSFHLPQALFDESFEQARKQRTSLSRYGAHAIYLFNQAADQLENTLPTTLMTPMGEVDVPMFDTLRKKPDGPLKRVKFTIPETEYYQLATRAHRTHTPPVVDVRRALGLENLISSLVIDFDEPLRFRQEGQTIRLQNERFTNIYPHAPQNNKKRTSRSNARSWHDRYVP